MVSRDSRRDRKIGYLARATIHMERPPPPHAEVSEPLMMGAKPRRVDKNLGHIVADIQPVGCATRTPRTPRTRWVAAWNSPPCVTTCGMPPSPRPRSICTATCTYARRADSAHAFLFGLSDGRVIDGGRGGNRASGPTMRARRTARRSSNQAASTSTRSGIFSPARNCSSSVARFHRKAGPGRSRSTRVAVAPCVAGGRCSGRPDRARRLQLQPRLIASGCSR